MPDSFIQIPFCRTEPVPQEKRKCPGFWEKLEKLLRAVCTKLEISACPCISLRRLVRILNSSGRFVKCVKTRVAAVSRRIARFLPALLQKHHFGKSYISSISCFNWKWEEAQVVEKLRAFSRKLEDPDLLKPHPLILGIIFKVATWYWNNYQFTFTELQTCCWGGNSVAYLIFVTDATDGVRVNFFWPV